MIARAHDKAIGVCARKDTLLRAAFTCLNATRRERGQREDLFNFSIMTIPDLQPRIMLNAIKPVASWYSIQKSPGQIRYGSRATGTIARSRAVFQRSFSARRSLHPVVFHRFIWADDRDPSRGCTSANTRFSRCKYFNVAELSFRPAELFSVAKRYSTGAAYPPRQQ